MVEFHGGQGRPPEPWQAGGDKGLSTSLLVRKYTMPEMIGPESPRRVLDDYMRFRYRGHPEIAKPEFYQKVGDEMARRMHTIPMRFAIARYAGPDVTVGQEEPHTFKAGDVVGANSSKQTFMYPTKWFETLLDVKDDAPMDDITEYVMSPSIGRPFVGYSILEGNVEGPLRQGEGAGFLLRIETDDRLHGMGIGSRMLRRVLGYYHNQVGLDYAFVYGRVTGISVDPREVAKATGVEPDPAVVETYDRIRREFYTGGRVSTGNLNRYLGNVMDGKWADPSVLIHGRSNIICGLPNYVKDDPSHNCGFLGIYDLVEMRKMGEI